MQLAIAPVASATRAPTSARRRAHPLRCIAFACLAAASFAGKHAAAEPVAGPPFTRCDTALRAHPESYEAALCWFEVATETGAWEQALQEVQRRRIALPANDWLVLVAAYLQTGLGHDGAVATYRNAAARFATHGNVRGELLARGSLSLLLSRLGRTADAAREVAQVVALGERSPDSELRIRARTVQARHLIDTGRDLDRALHILERASAELLPAHPYRLRLQIHADLGSLAHWLGHYEVAIVHYQRLAAAATAEGDREGVALALLGEATARHEAAMEAPRADAYPRLLALATAADAAARAARSPNLELAASHLLAELQLLRAPVLAKAHVARCLALAAQLDEPAARGECAWLQARVQAQRTPALASATMRRAVEWQVQSGDVQRLAYAWRQRMRLSLATQSLATAMADAEQALQAIETLRELQQGEPGRTAVLAAWSRDYYWLSGQLLEHAERTVDARMASDLRARAFAVTERMRARALREAIARQAPAGTQRGGSTVAEQARLDALVHRDRAALLAGVGTSAPGNTPARPDAPGRAQARAPEPRRQPAARSPTPLHDAVRATLRADEALLSYQFAPDRDVTGEPAGGSWLFVLTREQSRAYRLPDRVQLTDMLAVYAGMPDTAAADHAARRLHAALLAPALVALDPNIHRLIVIADGALHGLPIATLPVPSTGELLADRYTMSFVPSATLWLQWRQQAVRPFRAPALVLADPLGDAATVPAADTSLVFRDAVRAAGGLSFARREGSDVVTQLRAGSVLDVGAAANAASLRALTPGDYAIVHFAAHAITDATDPARSAIVLAPAAGDDGLLQAHEIARMRWDGRVIVLSACTSASGANLRGEGVLSLARSFFAGGARTVVGSLWRVRDDHARAFFAPFYRALAAGASVDEALRTAQQALRRTGLPAAAWAAFQVYGDGSVRPVHAALRSAAAHHHRLVGNAFVAGFLALAALAALLLNRGIASPARVR